MRSFVKGFVALSLVCAGFFCGFNADVLRDAPHAPVQATLYRLGAAPPTLLARLTRPRPAEAAGEEAYLDPTETYLATLNTVRSDFVHPAGGTVPDTTRLTYAAINGMLGTLQDRYTEFWTPKEYRANMEETSGVFAGIGAKLDSTKDNRVLITEPLENSPAARSGVQPGDIVLAVNGKPTLGLTVDKVIEMIKGDAGTSVRLTLERPGSKKPVTLAIKRAFVQSPVIEWRMEDEKNRIGYIYLEMFNEQADQQFAAALAKLEKQGMRALIFDLRDNPGGLLNVCREIASRFIPDGPVVWVKEKNGQMSPMNVLKRKHEGRLSTGAYPVVVLVNGSSASASEIVSGAIKDHGVGTLVGTTTYGKGLVQTIIPLADDSAVKITTQHYFTPNKTDINRKFDANGKQIAGGIQPDVNVALTDADMDRMQMARRANPLDRKAPDRFDPQMQKGLEILRTRLAAQTARNSE
jgi:C-terminal peptidase (prc)